MRDTRMLGQGTMSYSFATDSRLSIRKNLTEGMNHSPLALDITFVVMQRTFLFKQTGHQP